MQRIGMVLLMVVTMMAAVPRAVLACAVCFGQSDSPMAWGVNMGVFLMLGVTGAMLAAFATFFIYLMRRAKIAADLSTATEAGRYIGSVADPQEGTAQC